MTMALQPALPAWFLLPALDGRAPSWSAQASAPFTALLEKPAEMVPGPIGGVGDEGVSLFDRQFPGKGQERHDAVRASQAAASSQFPAAQPNKTREDSAIASGSIPGGKVAKDDPAIPLVATAMASRDFEFDALGVFGIRRDQAVPDRLQAFSAPQIAAPSQLSDAGPMTVPNAAARQSEPADFYRGVAAVDGGPVAPDPGQPLRGGQTFSDPSGPFQPANVPAPEEQQTPETTAEPAGASSLRTTTPRSVMPSPGLVVSGPDGGLVIAFRDPQGTAESSLRLRRLMENIAAEFGMSVQEVHCNGAICAPGGPYGRRPR